MKCIWIESILKSLGEDNYMISCRDCNKLLQTWQLKTSKKYSFTVLETGSSKLVPLSLNQGQGCSSSGS